MNMVTSAQDQNYYSGYKYMQKVNHGKNDVDVEKYHVFIFSWYSF
jgi:hypothetical protein